MGRFRYIVANVACLGVIALAAVMIYVGVGAMSSTKSLLVALGLTVVGLAIVGMIAGAAMKEPPRGWVRCSDDWVAKHGRAACKTSPKLNSKGVTHFHPAA